MRPPTVSYIDAGYAIAFGVLAAYAAVLWRRRQRLERAAPRAQGRTDHERAHGRRHPCHRRCAAAGEDGGAGARRSASEPSARHAGDAPSAARRRGGSWVVGAVLVGAFVFLW